MGRAVYGDDDVLMQGENSDGVWNEETEVRTCIVQIKGLSLFLSQYKDV